MKVEYEPIEIKITFENQEELEAFSAIMAWSPINSWADARGIAVDELVGNTLRHEGENTSEKLRQYIAAWLKADIG